MKIPAILLATVALAQEDYVAAVVDYDATAADYDAAAAVVDYTADNSGAVDYNGTDGIDAFERRGNKNKNQNKNQAAPAANYQAPAAPAYQAPADNYQAPAANYQAPADNYQAPAYGNDYKTPLKCWHCDAMSFDECAYKGQEKTCLVTFQKSCFQKSHPSPTSRVASCYS